MPTKTEIREMNKPQLVELGIEVFVDDGNLRSELEAMTKPDLFDLLITNGAAEPPEKVEPEGLPELVIKPSKGEFDLGSN